MLVTKKDLLWAMDQVPEGLSIEQSCVFLKIALKKRELDSELEWIALFNKFKDPVSGVKK